MSTKFDDKNISDVYVTREPGSTRPANHEIIYMPTNISFLVIQL